MTAARKLVHTARIPIRWGDMDALGHVNNTAYFRYMEQARIEWLYRRAQRPATAFATTGPVIVNASCTFLEPLLYPGDVEVRMFLSDPGRSSVGSFYELWMEARKHADGAARMVWIDMESKRPMPLPEELRDELERVG